MFSDREEHCRLGQCRSLEMEMQLVGMMGDSGAEVVGADCKLVQSDC